MTVERDEPDESSELTIVELHAAARHGDVGAMFCLGEAFRLGDQVPQNYEQALVWLRRAAERGDPQAQNNLGSMFLNGAGTPVDSTEATLWYQLAAQQGQPDAQFNLALRYLHGDGAPCDSKVAAYWLCKAVEQGHIEATGELGTLYRFGQGVVRNLISAAELHVVAASEGDVTSMGNLVDYQDEIENAALSGSVLAAVCLAKIHDRGIAVPKSKSSAWAWLQWATHHGTKDNDADVLEELQDWMAFEELFLSEDVKQQAEELLLKMEQKAGHAELR